MPALFLLQQAAKLKNKADKPTSKDGKPGRGHKKTRKNHLSSRVSGFLTSRSVRFLILYCFNLVPLTSTPTTPVTLKEYSVLVDGPRKRPVFRIVLFFIF